MKITLEWIKEKNACKEGVEYFKNNFTEIDPIELANHLISSNKIEKIKWANWLIVKVFNKEQCVRYAIYAAELVLHLYEAKYPDDKRPREAIEVAKNYLRNITSRDAAWAARDAAGDAAWAAWAARDAAGDAAWAAGAAGAAWAARDAAWAAWAARDARDARAARDARDAAWAAAGDAAGAAGAAGAAWAARDARDAAWAAWAARDARAARAEDYKNTLIKILNYGVELLTNEVKNEREKETI